MHISAEEYGNFHKHTCMGTKKPRSGTLRPFRPLPAGGACATPIASAVSPRSTAVAASSITATTPTTLNSDSLEMSLQRAISVNGRDSTVDRVGRMFNHDWHHSEKIQLLLGLLAAQHLPASSY